MSTPRSDIRIGRIEPEQGLLLRDLRLRSLADSPTAFGQPLDEARERPEEEWHRSARQSSCGDGRIWLLAHRGDDAVGLVQGRRRRPATLLLFSMWVEPSARGIGLGRGLVESLERWGTTWGAAETVLWVYGANETAIGFYRRLGFEVMRSGEDAESGARFGALVMRRTFAAPHE